MIDWVNPSDDVLEARRAGYNERDLELAEHIAFLESEVAGLRLEVAHRSKLLRTRIRFDRLFIDHIQSHLDPGQVVVCKICGRSAAAIIAEAEAAIAKANGAS